MLDNLFLIFPIIMYLAIVKAVVCLAEILFNQKFIMI